MKADRTSGGLEFLAWPTLAWLSGWGMAATAAERPQAPARRRRKEPRSAPAGNAVNVVRFPLERVRPLTPQAISREAATVIRLRSA
jgi:hypothetical protein